MKKRVNTLFLTLFTLSSIIFTSCEESGNYIYDIPPFDINIIIENSNGNNLLDPEYEGNIIDNLTLTYNDEVYKIDTEDFDISTRALPSIFHGLRLLRDDNGRHFITFGNFDGETDFNNEKISISYGKGKNDEVTFTNKVKTGSYIQKIDIKRTIKLNGKTVNPDIDIPTNDRQWKYSHEQPNGKAFVITR